MSLVRRTTRSVTLTAAGQQLVEETRASFVHIERGISGVKDLAGAPRGLVRMTAPVALGRQHIAPVIPALLERFPELRLELDLSDRFVNLTQEGFDVAVRHASRVPDSHVATVLCETRALLLASPKYLARRGVPAHPRRRRPGWAWACCRISRHGAARSRERSCPYCRSGGRRASSASGCRRSGPGRRERPVPSSASSIICARRSRTASSPGRECTLPIPGISSGGRYPFAGVTRHGLELSSHTLSRSYRRVR